MTSRSPLEASVPGDRPSSARRVVVFVLVAVLSSGCGGEVVIVPGSGGSTSSSTSSSSSKGTTVGSTSTSGGTCTSNDDCPGGVCLLGIGVCAKACDPGGLCGDACDAGGECNGCASSSCPDCGDCVAACVPIQPNHCDENDPCTGGKVCLWESHTCAPPCTSNGGCSDPSLVCASCVTGSCCGCEDCVSACLTPPD